MALTEPDFIERDADKITAEMIAQYERDTGKTLYPAQAERLLIDLWAYREMLIRVAIQGSGQTKSGGFAREPMIDFLGELVGVYRLAAQPASTQLQFSVDTALNRGCPDTRRHPRQCFRQHYFCDRYRCGTEGRITAGQHPGDLYRAGDNRKQLATGSNQSVAG